MNPHAALDAAAIAALRPDGPRLGVLGDPVAHSLSPQMHSAAIAALAALGAPLLIEVLAALETGKLKPDPQPHEGVTYAAKIDKTEARIDWREAAAAIDRRVRAFRPWPIAETRFHGEQVRIHRAAVAEIVDVEKNLDTQNNLKD